MKGLVSGVNQKRNPKGREWLDQVTPRELAVKGINRQVAKKRQDAKKQQRVQGRDRWEQKWVRGAVKRVKT